MKNIDYSVGKIKRMICFVFGHRLRPHYKLVLCDGYYVPRKIKYYKCTRCGQRVSVNEFKAKGLKAINTF